MEIRNEDFSMFLERAIDGMMAIAEELGDERVNQSPDLPGANSPYVILTHCVGVVDYWVGTLIAGRNIQRDRDAEFEARGPVSELRDAVADLKERLRKDLLNIGGADSLASPPYGGYNPLGDDGHEWNTGAVIVHTYEELAQHHGQMELTRDILLYAGESPE